MCLYPVCYVMHIWVGLFHKPAQLFSLKDSPTLLPQPSSLHPAYTQVFSVTVVLCATLHTSPCPLLTRVYCMALGLALDSWDR